MPQTSLTRRSIEAFLILSLIIASAPGVVSGADSSVISGKVRDLRGDPIEGAKVTLTGDGTPATTTVATTTADGTYEFRNLKGNVYSLLAEDSGFLPSAPEKVDTSSFPHAVLDFTLISAASSVSRPGAPKLEAAHIRGTVDAGGYSTPASVQASADLIATMDDLRQGSASSVASRANQIAAECDERLGEYVNSAHEYELAAKLDPTEENLFAQGYELILAQNYRAAIDVLRAGMQRYPKSLKLHIGIGVAFYLKGQSSEAVEAFLESSELKPRDGLPYLLLGKAEPVTGADLAEQVQGKLKRWVELYPENPDANFYYALSLGRNSEGSEPSRSEEVVLLKKAIRLNPDFASAHAQLASLYADSDHYSTAIAEYQKALRIAPGLTSAHYQLAQVYVKAGQMNSASQEMDQFRRLRASEKANAEDRQVGKKDAILLLKSQTDRKRDDLPPCTATDSRKK